jgi:predicted nicotinamide N-methyase
VPDPASATGFHFRTRRLAWGEPPWALDLEVLVDFEAESARLYAHRARLGLPADPDLSPMFGVIWPSAEVAARWVLAQPPEASVLELGCGLGLPALLAARRGARVRATDLHPDAGPFLAANARRNGVHVEYASLDMRCSEPDPVWDRVIATDVLFAWDMPAVVARAFADTLAPDGVGLLVDPGRAWSDAFPDAAAALGLTVDIDVDGELFALTVRRA